MGACLCVFHTNPSNTTLKPNHNPASPFFQVDNYFVAAGMNSSGIAAAGGMGKYLAELITTGEPSMDFWNIDIRRFVNLHNNKKFLRDRVKETLGRLLTQ